eukprot:TRINITY_DN26168_c0_g1_i1.p1 TRINITY_DN26168_c0_g1~~TRINITY_DN26168_c0_g1_i1.p1  ORF type:complete len:293 (-),score=56.68 TRINITY_DN26168_c0_g1_i1:26-841(-)
MDVLGSGGVLTNLSSFGGIVPGCHNTCPTFRSYFHPARQVVYFGVKQIDTAYFEVDGSGKIKPLAMPPLIEIDFLGENVLILSYTNVDILSLTTWNPLSGNTSKLSDCNTTFSPFLSAFYPEGRVLFSLDRVTTSMLVWDYSTPVGAPKVLPLPSPATPVWVNSLTMLQYLPTLQTLLALDRFGALWTIDPAARAITKAGGPGWGLQSNLSGRLQFCTRVVEGRVMVYYVGWAGTGYVLIQYDLQAGNILTAPFQGSKVSWEYLAFTEWIV